MPRRIDIKPLPSLEELGRLFTYDAESGILRWRVRPNKHAVRINPGDEAGTIGFKGYLIVGIGRSYFLAHRLIWKMVTGQDPVDQVDHHDTDRLNNRWTNLRPATNGPNIANSRLRVDNKSGVKGVSWDASHKSWVAHVTSGGRQRKIGRFKELAVAKAAVEKERARLHGEFARSQ